MNWVFVFVLFVIYSSKPLLGAASQGVSHSDNKQYRGFDFGEHLSTKTPYFPLQTADNRTEPPPGCKAIYLNFLARHGIRDPTSDDIKSLDTLQEQIQGNRTLLASALGNSTELSWIVNWTNPYEFIMAGQLEETGETEHYLLSKRLAVDYPDVFSTPFISLAYPMRSTQVSRTSRSANSFGLALFEGKGELGACKFKPFYVYSASENEDRQLRFFATCPKYTSDVLGNKTTYDEAKKWFNKRGPIIAESVSAMLNWTIDAETAFFMFKACAFEYSLDGTADRWCALFREEDFLVWEYYKDLKLFYESGYGGTGLGYRIAYPLLTSMIDDFDGKIGNKGRMPAEKASLRFAHAETLIPFVALMGLFKDHQRWTADSPWDQIVTRQWRSSVISPYAGNAMLILYNCTGAADQGADFRVKLLHNEKEHVMPNCDGKLYCPYDQFKKNYVPKPIVGTITGSIAIVLGVGIGFLAGWNGKGRDVEKQRKQAYQPIA